MTRTRTRTHAAIMADIERQIERDRWTGTLYERVWDREHQDKENVG